MRPPRNLSRSLPLRARQNATGLTEETQAIARVYTSLTPGKEVSEMSSLDRKRSYPARIGKAASKKYSSFLDIGGCAYTTLMTLMGDIMIVGSPRGIHAVLMCGENSDRAEMDAMAIFLPEGHSSLLSLAKAEMKEYFAGSRQTFSFPLAPLGGTHFQQRVWQSLRDIPYGETICYQQQAVALGLSPTACRAVGGANGKNLLAIVVPCHRVLGKNGSLTGFASGVHNKEFLLNLEKGALLKLHVC